MNQFNRKVMVGLIAAMFVFVGVGVLTYQRTVAFIDSSRNLMQDHQVLEKLLLILEDISDAKSGQRDFIITGQESFLTSCQNSLFGVDQKLKDVRDMIVKGDSSQKDNLEKLNFLLVKEIDFFKQTVDARRNEGFKAAVKLIQTSTGAETMDDLHQLVWNIQDGERTLLKKQADQLEVDSNSAKEAFCVGLVVDGALLLLVYLFVRGEIRKRNQVERRLGATTDILQSVMEKMVDAVMVSDTQGRLLLTNPAAKKMMGIDMVSTPTLEAVALKAKVFQVDKITSVNVKDRPLYRALLGEETTGMEMYCKNTQTDQGLFLYSTATPLKDKNGRIVGGVAVYSDITERKNKEGLILQDNSRLKESVDRLEQYNHEIHILSKLVESLQACLSIEEVAKTSVTIMSELFPEASGGILTINNSKTRVELLSSFGEKNLSLVQFAPEDCWALRRAQTHHVDKNHRNLLCQHFGKEEAPVEYICVPLAAQGTQVGLFHIGSTVEGRLGKAKRKLASLMGEQVALAIANLKLKEALKNQSIRDALTNLFNRRYLEESMEREVARAERGNAKLSILMMDIDHFKQFNDKFGHEAGDRVLWEVGSFLNKFVRKSDVACRYGGEELVILLPDTNLGDARDIAEKIREGVKSLNLSHLNMSLGTVTISIGVSVFPEDGQKGAEVLRQADIALYNAKSLGRDQVVCWRDVSSEGKRGMPRFVQETMVKPTNAPLQN